MLAIGPDRLSISATRIGDWSGLAARTVIYYVLGFTADEQSRLQWDAAGAELADGQSVLTDDSGARFAFGLQLLVETAWSAEAVDPRLAALAAVPFAHAGATLDRVKSAGAVRVCIWPDYYGITYRSPRTNQLVGIDIDLSGELAHDLGVQLRHVDSSFAALIDDVKGDRCDVAMFAVGMLPQRMEQLKFTRPYLQSDIYAITTRSNRVVKGWADIDQPGVNVAVQAGTFMEPVMAAALKQAKMVIVKPPATREQELESGRVDVFMTDYPYSRRLLDRADWAVLVSPPQPFRVLPYAYAVKPGDDAWLAAVNDFVARIKRDGRLEAAAKRNGLAEIIVRHEEAGCPIFNPHEYTLEGGGMKKVDQAQLAFKREADPLGLLNPGKMIGWGDPDYDQSHDRQFLYEND